MNIQALIDESLAKERESRKDRKRSGKMSPSSFGMCFRRQFWQRSGEEESNPPDARSLRVFKAGNLFESFVDSLLPPHDKQVLVETDEIKGYADIVTEDAVGDIKSQHSKAFWYSRRPEYDVNVEKRHNILQVMTYAMILGKPKGFLAFISKDDLCVEQYWFMGDKWFPAVEKEIETNKMFLERFERTVEIPPAAPRAFKTECSFCPFKDKCFKLEDRE